MELHSLGTFPDRARRPRRSGPPIWTRTLRTIWLGLLLGFIGALLVIAGTGITLNGHTARLDPKIPPRVAEHARRVLPALPGGPLWTIVSQIESPWGEVVRLRPRVRGIEVRGADCVLHQSGSAVAPRFERELTSIPWVSMEAALVSAAQGAKDGHALAEITAGAGITMIEEPVWFVELPRPISGGPEWTLHAETTLSGGSAALASALARLPWRGEVPEADGRIDLLLTLDPATLEVTEARDGRFLAQGSSLLFDPNPVAVSGDAGLRDGDEVDRWRRAVTLERLDGSGYLRGSRVEALTGRPERAQEPSRNFLYSSSDPHFEEAMAYFHGDRSLARADSLGFRGLFARPLRLRAHGTSADNSWYSRPGREVVLGDGGVDDGEDADIIFHESGHALHDAIVPGFGAGDTRAISEGFSDFWAASLTGGPCVGDWDATSYSPPCLRRTDAPAVHPSWLNGLAHHDGMLWSALLWDLRGILGASDAERLALAALFEQDTSTSWTEAAAGLLRAAERLGLSGRMPEVREALARRGFGPLRVEALLGPGESRRIELLAPGRFLDREADTLVVQGDGSLLFRRASGAGPDREAPPTAVPCGLAGDAPELRLAAAIDLDGSLASIALRWLAGEAEIARVAVRWRLDTGRFDWRYENPPTSGADRFYAAAIVGPPDGGSSEGGSSGAVPSIPLQSVTLTGVGGLQAFRAPISDQGSGGGSASGLLGARFEIASEGGEGFRLRSLSRPMRAASDGPVLEAHPNPMRARGEIRLLLPRAAPAEVAVYDVSGRRVRLWERSERPAGVSVFEWTGTDEPYIPHISALICRSRNALLRSQLRLS